MKCTRYSRFHLSRNQAEQLCSLWEEVWPSDDKTPLGEKAVAFLRDTSREHRMEEGSELFHLLEEEGRVVAAARTYVREVCFKANERFAPVLGLAGVCTSPKLQGQGLGALVVRDAFARLGPRLQWCLYQTQVPGFYEKLGACRVGNEFVDSFATDPEARPWWDEYVMVYGCWEKWPSGRVDLCGVAY